MDNKAVQVKDLHKYFGEIKAVNGADFEIKRGEIFSLLGPNGAGKSTLISLLSCLTEPTSGEAWVMGSSILTDSGAVRASIGVVPQEIALYPDLSALENLKFWGRMYGLRGKQLLTRAAEILEVIGLTGRQGDKVGNFSGGMKRRVNIGIALMHKPELIIMDEPTVGIDPQSRRHILDNVKQLNSQGMTVLYTTHYMEEAQELSDHIAVMDQGKVIAAGTHDELVNIVGELDRIDLQINAAADRVLESWRRATGVHKVTADNGTLTLLVNDSNLVLPELFQLSADAGVRITSVDIQEPNLEAVFLHLTGRALRN
ncbi:MAG: ABC transporter ATP-binding protein [Anaerolineales bacterium]|nr:ABC transporter ATP-binding protein [Anaerolineales bacterium]